MRATVQGGDTAVTLPGEGIPPALPTARPLQAGVLTHVMRGGTTATGREAARLRTSSGTNWPVLVSRLLGYVRLQRWTFPHHL